MKFCKDCANSQKEVVAVHGTAQTVYFCSEPNCLNPVDAGMFPCDFVRREVVFCGIGAKYFKPKEETPNPNKGLIELK